MKNSSDTIGNRTRDLQACSAVPQPTALPRAPHLLPGLLIEGFWLSYWALEKGINNIACM
jgi:hypothetical protein